jgi:hypothetical protein
MTPFNWEADRQHLVDHLDHFLTVSLFEELKRPDVDRQPLFSLENWRRVYVYIADPTEYSTAMVLIGNWQHWQAMRANKTLAKHFDEWSQEVEIKLRSAGVLNMISLAGSTAPGASASAKWLAEAGFVTDQRLKTKAGRKKEEDVKDQIKSRVATDAQRLGITVVK